MVFLTFHNYSITCCTVDPVNDVTFFKTCCRRDWANDSVSFFWPLIFLFSLPSCCSTLFLCVLSPPHFFNPLIATHLFDLPFQIISFWLTVCMLLTMTIRFLINCFVLFCFIFYLFLFSHFPSMLFLFLHYIWSYSSLLLQVQSTSWMPHQQYVMQPTVSLWSSFSFSFFVTC